MNNTTRVILGSLRYKSSPNTDIGVKIPFQQSYQDIVEFDRSSTIDLDQVFDDERQKSTIFRPSTKITIIFKNAYTGETSYNPYKNNLYYVDELFYRENQITNVNSTSWGGFPTYNEFDFIRNDYNVSGYTQPPNEHLIFNTKSASTYNWNYYISYTYSSDTNTNMEYYGFTNPFSWKVSDGIPFEYTNIVINGKNLISFKCAYKHGLTIGEYIHTSIKFNGENLFQVYSLGNGIFGTEEYYVNIFDVGFLSSVLPSTNVGTLKRVIDAFNSGETMSSYYVRRHKIITNPGDALLLKAGFELNNFEFGKKFFTSAVTPDYQSKTIIKENNQSYTLTFSRDIDINGLLDNNNRPITELFFTIIHHGYFGWFYSGGELTKLRRGWGFNLEGSNLPTNVYWEIIGPPNQTNDLRLNTYTSNSKKFNYVVPLLSGNTLEGDVCEWNDFDQKERVVSNLYYKINYNSSNFNIFTNGLNPEGYYYSPHYPVKIKDFSTYIEEGRDDKVTEIPNYSFFSKFRKAFRWRDIYTYGFIDETGTGVDYPFINGVHYPYINSIFRIIPEGTNTPDSEFLTTQDPTIDDCE